MASKHSKRKRGGFLGGLISQALVPFSLLGMQQSYRKKIGGKKTHARRSRSGGKTGGKTRRRRH